MADGVLATWQGQGRRRAGAPLAWLGLLFLAHLQPACADRRDDCFLPPSIVDAPRVIAVRADPPDQVVDLDGSEEPLIEVRALFAGQTATSTLSLGGTLCPALDELACPPGSLAVPTGPLAPGSDHEARTSFRVPLSLLRAAQAADPLRGFEGIRVQFDAEGRIDQAGSRARKLLIFQTKQSGAIPNHPIELGELELAPLDGALMEPFDPLARPWSLEVGVAYAVRPRVLPGAGASEAAEVYDGVDLQGRAYRRRESISYSFFTTEWLAFGDQPRNAASILAIYIPGADVADEPEPGTPDPPRGLVRLNALYALFRRPGGPVPFHSNLWAVARDARGAVAWTQTPLLVTDRRACHFTGSCADQRIICTTGAP